MEPMKETNGVKTMAIEMVLNHWPYGLEVCSSAKGLLLRPRRKARADWRKAFRQPRRPSDDLAATRHITNEFDVKEWEW
jgi:hypothetical protein